MRGARPTSGRAAIVLLTTLGLGAVSAAPAAAAAMDADTKVATWDTAASTLGTAGSLWEPTWTGDRDLNGRLSVLADNLTFANGAVAGGDTFVGARYGTRKNGVLVQEKWAGTGWSAEPVFTTSAAKVERVSLRVGDPGMRYTVRATVYADCFEQPSDSDPVPVPRRFRCTRSDVLEHGGTLVMTMRPASTMTAPGTTSIVLQSAGLTYRQLLRVARNLEQVAGTPTVAGSAQMVGMCRQMVDERMTSNQASAFASEYGYTLRVGSVDGQPMAVTMDYRRDRFTVAIVGDAVTGCTYG